MHKAPRVFPIVGGRKVEHLHANIEALSIALTPEQIKALDNIVPFKKGFPYDMFVRITAVSRSFFPVLTCLMRYRAMAQITTSSTPRPATLIGGPPHSRSDLLLNRQSWTSVSPVH